MKQYALATTAMAVVFVAGAAAAQDLGSNSYGAGVSLLSPEQTGFLYAGTAEVTGLGSAAVVIAAEAATFNMTGFGNSGISTQPQLPPCDPQLCNPTGDPTNNVPVNSNPFSEAVANSGVLTTFQFDRTVTASASSVGTGRVVAQGDASSSVGAVGSAFGDTLSNRITTSGIAPDSGTVSSTSNANSESAASLVGNGATSVLAGLIGTTNGFVGSTGTSVTSDQSGIAYSALNAFGDAAGTGINIAPGAGTDFAALSTELKALAAGQGAVGFSNDFDLGNGGIDLAVSNVGGGTISLGAQTGGFFSGGAATSGQSGFGAVFTADTVK